MQEKNEQGNDAEKHTVSLDPQLVAALREIVREELQSMVETLSRQIRMQNDTVEDAS